MRLLLGLNVDFAEYELVDTINGFKPIVEFFRKSLQ